MNDKPKYAIIPNPSGDASELPPEVMEDIKESFKRYFKLPHEKLMDGWDIERRCKVFLDTKNKCYIFCKLVAHQGEAKIMAVSLRAELTDEWMNTAT